MPANWRTAQRDDAPLHPPLTGESGLCAEGSIELPQRLWDIPLEPGMQYGQASACKEFPIGPPPDSCAAAVTSREAKDLLASRFS